MWFRWRPFWMCHKTRLRGGKNWTPIFLAYLTPNKVKKTIKSILARTFNFRHISDIPRRTITSNLNCVPWCTRLWPVDNQYLFEICLRHHGRYGYFESFQWSRSAACSTDKKFGRPFLTNETDSTPDGPSIILYSNQSQTSYSHVIF